MHDHARIAKSGTLNGVFTREGGAQQKAASLGHLVFRVKAVGKLLSMPQERLGQAVMSALKPREDIVVTSLHLSI